MSHTILNIRHYKTPTLEGIVHPSSNTGNQLDRLSHYQYHNRNRYGQRHPAESSARDSRCSNPDRRGDEHWLGREVKTMSRSEVQMQATGTVNSGILLSASTILRGMHGYR